MRVSKVMILDKFPHKSEMVCNQIINCISFKYVGNFVSFNLNFDDVDSIYKRATYEGASVIFTIDN